MKQTVQTQPSQSDYGFEFTDLLPRLTRASFRAATGQQAAPWDRERRISRIYDEDALLMPPEEPYVIKYWDAQGSKVTRRTEIITAYEASHPNLPGLYEYPKYTPKKSGLYVPSTFDVNGRPDTKTYVDAFSIADYETAAALREELRAAGIADVAEEIQEEQMAPPYNYGADAGENRRVLNLVIKGAAQNVGWLLKNRYANGVGSPGEWKQGEYGLAWSSAVSSDVGTYDPRPETHVPQRDLLPNEQIVVVNIGVALIRRTDIANPIEDEKAGPGRIRQILGIVTEIRANQQQAIK